MNDRKTANCPSCGYTRSSSDYWQHSCIRVLQKDRAELQEQYHDLLLEVANVTPNETRHESAKRIIHNHENHIYEECKAKVNSNQLCEGEEDGTDRRPSIESGL